MINPEVNNSENHVSYFITLSLLLNTSSMWMPPKIDVNAAIFLFLTFISLKNLIKKHVLAN